MEREFSDHATEQLIRRRITKKLVLAAIKNPGSVKTSVRGRNLYQKRISDKVLEIITVEEGEKLVIITAYFVYENKLRSKN